MTARVDDSVFGLTRINAICVIISYILLVLVLLLLRKITLHA